MIYHTDAQAIATFDGSRWTSLKVERSTAPTSTNPTLDVFGLALEKPILHNTALQDKATNGGVLIPILAASSIKNPGAGLFFLTRSEKNLCFLMLIVGQSWLNKYYLFLNEVDIKIVKRGLI